MIGILGGTFDPIHRGHITIAQEMQKKFHLAEMLLVPCYQPVHRIRPQASPAARLAMLKLALEDYPKIKVDERELKSQKACYTIDTLKQLRQEFGKNQSLAFILGMDAFNHFSTWKDYLHILELCHLIIINRPKSHLSINAELTDLLKKHQTNDEQSLMNTPAGSIYCYEISPLNFSATAVREQGASTGLDKIDRYIQQHHLYSSHFQRA